MAKLNSRDPVTLPLNSKDLMWVEKAGVSEKIEIDQLKYDITSSGWTPVFDTWTYSTTKSITITGDVTDKYQPGMKFKLKQGAGDLQGEFYEITYSAPDTTLKFTGGTIANAIITDNYISSVNAPTDYAYQEININENVEFEFSSFSELEELVLYLTYIKVKRSKQITLKATGNIIFTNAIVIANINFDLNIDLNGYTLSGNNISMFRFFQCQRVVFYSNGKILGNKTPGTYAINAVRSVIIIGTSGTNTLYVGESGNNNGFGYAIYSQSNSYIESAAGIYLSLSDNYSGGFTATNNSYILTTNTSGTDATNTSPAIGVLGNNNSMIN